MTLKHAFFCILAATHLVLVVCGAVHWPPEPPPADRRPDTGWDKALEMVRDASGSDHGHGYFSTGIGPVNRLIFILRDPQGRTWPDVFEKTGAHEADLRFVEIVDTMMDDDALRDHFARACGRAMLVRHPTATQVTIRVEEDDMPSMEAYRAGARVKWTTEYELTLTRGQTEEKDQDQNED
jgi:hypothetical protein